MIAFHFVYNLHYLYGIGPSPYELLRVPPGVIISLTFYPIAGISSGLSRNSFKNGVRLLACAMGLSLFSYLLLPAFFISFGTLHLLAVAMLLTPLWNKLSDTILAAIATASILLGIAFSGTIVSVRWLFPFGLISPGFTSADYFPIFPYLGPYLIGIIIYRRLYASHRASLLPREWSWTKGLQAIGRRSLMVYLLHQPIILLLQMLFLGLP